MQCHNNRSANGALRVTALVARSEVVPARRMAMVPAARNVAARVRPTAGLRMVAVARVAAVARLNRSPRPPVQAGGFFRLKNFVGDWRRVCYLTAQWKCRTRN